MNEIQISSRKVGESYRPLVIAEVGINHNGNLALAKQMVEAAKGSGCECVKFQCHVVEDEMSALAKKTIPGNASVSIWEIMKQAALSEEDEIDLKQYVEAQGLIYLSTPFSRAAAIRLEKMGVAAYKIGSGECNNYPLIEHIARYGKPIILSTGMNDLVSIGKAVSIIRANGCPYALLHCTSMYPTPYHRIRLEALTQMREAFPDAVLGLSDHSLSPYPCIGAVALGASILERHFTHDKSLPGPDIEISMDPAELKQIVEGSDIVWQSLKGKKEILPEEQVTIDFAYATVVTLKEIRSGEPLTPDNIWVKRPGIGEIKAVFYQELLGRCVKRNIGADEHLKWEDIQS